MKTKILLFATAIMMAMSFGAHAQAPEKFNYQGIARDNTGAALANQALGLRISILNPSNTAVYVETHSATTNDFGLYHIAIGDGTPVSGTMAAVNWAGGSKKIKVEIDPNGGTSYTDLGTTELLSVPYALYAAAAPGGGGSAVWTQSGSEIAYTGGNVGVGAANPISLLHVDNGSAAGKVATIDGGNDMFIEIRENGGYVGYLGSYSGDADDVDFGTGAGSTAKVHLVTKASPKLTIDKDGQVGIGTTAPNVRLDVTGADSGPQFVRIHPTTISSADDLLELTAPSSTVAYQFIEANDGTSNVFVLGKDGSIDSDGNVSAVAFTSKQTAATTPGLTLEENGSTNDWALTFASTNNLWFEYNGSLASFINTSGTYSTSDRRLKENIEPVSPVLDRVKQIAIRRYTMKADEEHMPTIGYIAQDLLKQFPEMVKLAGENREGVNYYGVNYGAMSAVAIKAVQEQQQIIEDLQNTIKKMQARLDALER